MEGHCDPCKDVSRRLMDFRDTRRRGELFEPEVSDDALGTFARFGTIGEIFSRTECPSCTDLVQEILRWEKEEQWKRSANLIVGLQVSDYRHSDEVLSSQPMYLIAQDPSGKYDNYQLMNFWLLERAATEDECGRLFDSRELDIELVEGWLRCCDVTHGEYCKSGLTSHLPAETFPARILLVDLDKKCLCYSTLSEKYVALSYVWGKTTIFRTTSTNLQEFLKPGSINFENQELRLPETIRDFFRLADRLRIRYAWVDSLCIVQDGDDLQEQLNGMAAIFASTYLTVVAEGSDANSGLLGVGNGSKPRNYRCPIVRLPEIPCIIEDNAIPVSRPKTWDTRAWTFQEGLFSRRLLFFDVAGFAGWKCPRQYWYETHEKPSEAMDWVEAHPEQTDADWRYLGFSLLNFEWPDMRRWCELAEEYYQRAMSFDADALNAIAGLHAVMEKTSPGGFHWGLPELFFDIYFLWDVSGKAERKECKDIPSWSFLGWKGGSLDVFWWRFSMDHTFLDQPDRGFGCDCEVGSIVKWFTGSKDRSSSTPVANSFHMHRSGDGDEPHLGWTKHISEKDGSTTYYMHESIPNSFFRYPFPLFHAIEDASYEQFSPYLRFKAKRGWLNVGSKIKPNSEDWTAALKDDSGNWAGTIRLPSTESEGSTEAPKDVEAQGDQLVELIAIASGKLRNDAFPKASRFRMDPGWTIPEWELKERPQDEDFYEFYFVLSIDWHNDIALRTGLGRVEKKAWERLPLEEMNITLG